LKIGILGTRGIPNNYGGFEQFAEFFAVYLVSKGHEAYVYSSHSHEYQESTYKGVNIIHCKDPENKIGTVGQFIYDLNCIRDSRKRDFDILLQLGYTSSTIWRRLLPKKAIIITNMDGLEWKRSKYSKPVRSFLKYAEKLGVKGSDYLIADSMGIQSHLKRIYGADSHFIAYGADVFNTPDESRLKAYDLVPGGYNMLIARMEPENNIETILDGVAAAGQNEIILVVGKYDVNDFGRKMKEKYSDHSNIRFLGGIYDLDMLNNLRHFSKLYFHGHSVGGTNPSLLEAMASNSLIVAHKNEFNAAILDDDAFYFESSADVTEHLNNILDKKTHQEKTINNLSKIENHYSWDKINQAYLDFFEKVYERN